MADSKTVQSPGRSRKKGVSTPEAPAIAAPLSAETKQKLAELDAFIENILQEAGEEFLEEFRQVEGE